MKKYILFAMALVLSVSVFAGCAPTNTHKEAKAEIEAFLTNETYSEIINADFYYSAKIEAEIVSDADFGVLDTLETLVDMSLSTAKGTYQSFTIAPLNKAKGANEKCGAVVAALEDVEAQFEDFSRAKTSFVANIENLDIDGNGAKAELGIMEKELGSLVAKLTAFNSDYENAYTALYGGVPETTSDAGKVKNAVISVFSDLLQCYVDYSLKEFGYDFNSGADTYLTNLYLLNTYIKTATAKTAAYAAWYAHYELFKGEVKVFKTSLSNINLKNFPSAPSTKEQIYKEKVENFISTNASIFIQKTISMLY